MELYTLEDRGSPLLYAMLLNTRIDGEIIVRSTVRNGRVYNSQTFYFDIYLNVYWGSPLLPQIRMFNFKKSVKSRYNKNNSTTIGMIQVKYLFDCDIF